MFKTTKIDHVAVNTNDMEATLRFYCGILGMKLARTSRTGDGRRHYNVEIGGGNAFAFFDGAERPDNTTAQYLNHFALPVATEAEFDEAYKNLQEHGVDVTEIIERGYGKTFHRHPGSLALAFSPALTLECRPLSTTASNTVALSSRPSGRSAMLACTDWDPSAATGSTRTDTEALGIRAASAIAASAVGRSLPTSSSRPSTIICGV